MKNLNSNNCHIINWKNICNCGDSDPYMHTHELLSDKDVLDICSNCKGIVKFYSQTYGVTFNIPSYPSKHLVFNKLFCLNCGMRYGHPIDVPHEIIEELKTFSAQRKKSNFFSRLIKIFSKSP